MDTAIESVRAGAMDVELHTPFGIATGTVAVARNVLVQIRLADGTRGLGEAAPFSAVNGETQADALRAIRDAASVLRNRDVTRYRELSSALDECLADAPSARCALETAILDAGARHRGLSLWRFFGGSVPELRTDITIVTGSVDDSARAAERAARAGFDILKIKIGGGPLELDVERLNAVAHAAPSARWILDGNCAFDAEQAVDLVSRLAREADRIVLFEQPTPADDLEGLARTHAKTNVPVAADESARSAADVARIAHAGAAQIVNVKITKSGVVEALDMVATARAHGLSLMIGGMVETELAMTMSACLAAGVGGFRYVDLDTPLFMRDSPMTGGYSQSGPRLGIQAIASGHGVTLRTTMATLED